MHGGNQITMLYGHMLTSNVQTGQKVSKGTAIGQSGYAGTGDHLHLEARAYCPGMGYAEDYRFVDPTLVANGYYATHDACSE
jgi:murein DD-endopeptidase MepM/ murein hydrolase activator NlpD